MTRNTGQTIKRGKHEAPVTEGSLRVGRQRPTQPFLLRTLLRGDLSENASAYTPSLPYLKIVVIMNLVPLDTNREAGLDNRHFTL